MCSNRFRPIKKSSTKADQDKLIVPFNLTEVIVREPEKAYVIGTLEDKSLGLGKEGFSCSKSDILFSKETIFLKKQP